MAETEQIPRGEHPRPQFYRQDWVNLNGTWTFSLDAGKSGLSRKLHESRGLDGRIVVPFAPESVLSGVAHVDFIECMWYQRMIAVPGGWRGRRVLLHFGAVDYECEVFVDSKRAGSHRGGSSSFTVDITPLVKPGSSHSLVVHVRDEQRSGRQTCGKQCSDYYSRGCSYTRTTGIWQTVWMEAVAPQGLRDCRITPDLDGGRFIVEPRFLSAGRALIFRVSVSDGASVVASAEVPASDGCACDVRLSEPQSWSPASPFLYELTLDVLDSAGAVIDSVRSYAGLRKVHVEGGRILLNNEPIHLRLVLDQGFYPDGTWTAPSDDALRRDIELSMAAGFNGARLHQKVFEERFHYWADKLGYLTWGESASWGMAMWQPASDEARARSAWNFLSEWREVVQRDRNHPSIIAWTPFNETRGNAGSQQHARLHLDAYDLTGALDPTRPVNDSSGYIHYRTDLYTVHRYEQDPAKLVEDLTPTAEKGVFRNFPEFDAPYEGQPYIVDEFGGIKWIPEGRRPYSRQSWGYGQEPKTIEEFYRRLEGMVRGLAGLAHVTGWCYTQLTDVEQEQNGIYNYDRTPKFDMARIAKIFRGQ
jgi:beta-galactosidase/beta-glucuronidase